MKTNIKRNDFVTLNNEMVVDRYGKTLTVPAGTLFQVGKTSRIGLINISNPKLDFGLNMRVKAESVTKTAPPAHSVKIGDIFASDWGYEQTQTTWFKVIGVSDRMLKVVELGEKRVYSGHMCGQATVNLNDVGGRTRSVRVNVDFNGNPGFRVNSYSYAVKADPNQSRFFSEWH